MAPLFVFSQTKKKDTTTRVTNIEEVVFQKQSGKTTDLSAVKISAKDAQNVASISGGIEGFLKPYLP
jgi:hypothetical protein